MGIAIRVAKLTAAVLVATVAACGEEGDKKPPAQSGLAAARADSSFSGISKVGKPVETS